jgi:hypothetical protein
VFITCPHTYFAGITSIKLAIKQNKIWIMKQPIAQWAESNYNLICEYLCTAFKYYLWIHDMTD